MLVLYKTETLFFWDKILIGLRVNIVTYNRSRHRLSTPRNKLIDTFFMNLSPSYEEERKLNKD